MSKGTRKIYSWFGSDASNEESLFEYGMLMRNVRGQRDFQVVYLTGFVDGEERYDYGWFDLEGMKKDCLENKGTDRFPSVTEICRASGCDEDTYFNDIHPATFLQDLLSTYSPLDIFGESYGTAYTEKEIRKRLGRAL